MKVKTKKYPRFSPRKYPRYFYDSYNGSYQTVYAENGLAYETVSGKYNCKNKNSGPEFNEAWCERLLNNSTVREVTEEELVLLLSINEN